MNYKNINCSLIVLSILVLVACNKAEIISNNEKEWLKNHPNLIVGISPNAPPYQFVNDKGELVGIFIDFLSIIENKLDYKFKKIYQSDFSKLLTDTKTNNVDILLEVQKTDERQQFLNFTPFLLSHNHVFVVKKSLSGISSIDDLKDKNISVVHKYAIQEYLTKNYPQLQLTPLPDDVSCLRSVSTGQTDAFICQQAVATYYIEHEGISNLQISGEIEYTNKLAIASRKNLDTLNSILTKAVNSISNKEKLSIYNNWLSSTVRPFYQEAKFWIIIILVVLFILFFTILFNLILRKRVMLKTSELKIAKEKVEESKNEIMMKNEEYEAINEELKQTNEELKQAKEQAEESDRLKTAFLQNMSHEIRTPLNAINGFSGLLDKPELSESKRKSFVSIIQSSSSQLLSIVSDILTISSIETKQEKLNIEKVCINNIIVDLLSVFKLSISNNISIYPKLSLNDKLSIIYTDKTKITQILSNLISNALKFTHQGFIEFGYIVIKETYSEDINHQMQFYVKDSGIGIKPELHEKIFDRFRQADLSINKNYGGTGLGLSISKGLVELLDGKIWVESEPEKGSTFYFSIPYRPVNETDNQISPTKQSENFKTILVAEDEEYNFLFIEELLIDMDLKLIHAKNGKEALEICKTNNALNLVLMDIKMPIMDGHAAAKQIKEFCPNLPIIALSAYALEHEKAKYIEVFDDYITKPVNEDELIQKLLKYNGQDLISNNSI